MLDFFIFILCIVLLYAYYRLCKWLTYSFFTITPEKTGDWVDDYLIVYGKKTLGIILLLPFALILIAVVIFAIAGSNKSGNFGGLGSFGSSDGGGDFRIQYRRRGTWVDGPGSNNERIAETMFDNFVANDPRGENRCRLVRKVNGRVDQVLSTN
jgi:hypothetical protein